MTTGKSPDRRRFIKSTAKTVVAGSLVGSLVSQPSTAFGYHTGVDDKLRIGLVGCGGRGTGAVINALKADSNSEVTAVADAFQDRIDVCLKSLGRNKLAKDRMNVTPERQFRLCKKFGRLGCGCSDFGDPALLSAQPATGSG